MKNFFRKDFFRALFSIRKIFWIFLLLSSVVLIFFIFVNDNKLIYLENILIRLSTAYISSFIFYYLVVVIKEYKDYKIMKEIINKFIEIILNDTFSLVRSLSKFSAIQIDTFLPSKAKLCEMCKAIKEDDKASLYFYEADMAIGYDYDNWLELLKYYKKRIENSIDNILISLRTSDPLLVTYLSQIKNSELFVTLEHMKYPAIQLPEGGTASLSIHENNIYKLFEKIKLLAKHMNYDINGSVAR